MIKLRKGDTVVFGLTDENVERLKKGQPIQFNMTELGLPNQTVIIIHGKDEQTFREMFKDQINPLKTVIKDYKAKDN